MTKKLLVAFRPGRPHAKSSDFLVPMKFHGDFVLIGLKSGKQSELGLLVFVGRSISANDLFAKLVNADATHDDVNHMLDLFRDYLNQVKALRIGNVVRISQVENGSKQFRLELVAKSPLSLPREPD